MAAPSSLDPYDKARAWYAATLGLRATTVTRYGPSAWGVRTPRWPASYAHNALVLTADPGAGQTIAWADEALAGLAHRQVMALCPLSAATLDGLAAAGYELQPEVLMARPAASEPLPVAPGVVVEPIDPYSVQLQQLQARLWHEEWLPSADDETVAQLVDRRSELDRAGAAASLVVRAGGDPVACLDVTVRDGVAELDGLATLLPYRGRAYGLALMGAGVEHARNAGVDMVVFTALLHDWPREWYERLGFTTLGPATEATRTTRRHCPGGRLLARDGLVDDHPHSDVAT